MSAAIEFLKSNREQIFEKCIKNDTPCSRVDSETNTCSVYFKPQIKWRHSDCPMADLHLKEHFIPEKIEKKRIGQQKQKKRK